MSSKYVVNIYIYFEEYDTLHGPLYETGEMRSAHCGSYFLDDREKAISIHDKLYETAIQILREENQ